MGEAEHLHVAVEFVARNLIAASIPDNRGAQPDGALVVAGGRAELPSTWDAAAVRAAIAGAGVDVQLSDDADIFATPNNKKWGCGSHPDHRTARTACACSRVADSEHRLERVQDEDLASDPDGQPYLKDSG